MNIIIILGLCIIFFILIFIIFFQYYKNKNYYNQYYQAYNNLHEIQTEINALAEQKGKLINEIKIKQDEANVAYNVETQKVEKQLQLYKNNSSYAAQQYIDELEHNYTKAEQQYDIKFNKLQQQEQQYNNTLKDLNNQITDLTNTLTAGVRAQMRAQEREKQLNFYKLTVSDNNLEDIKKLENIKISLHHPDILSKLIWTTYFQKQATELCNRVVGATEKKCGIYKITDLITEQYYIGQSINIADRFKQHIKCGLGIDTPATNKLYAAMQRDGVWNFTFEVLEECPKEQLNEKESFWIQAYDAYNFGLNQTKGNKT